MPRVQWRSDGRAEVDVPKAHHQVAGVEHRALYFVEVGQVVDAPDELQVARAPGRVLAYRGHVFFDGQLAGRIVPGQRQMHDAGRHLQILCGAHRVPFTGDDLQ